MIVKEEIEDILQKKLWKVEEISTKAKGSAVKAKQLPEGARRNIPVFSGGWSEENVTSFYEKFEESVRDPLRHNNRKQLEDIGIYTKGIPEAIFDDSNGVEEVVALFNSLKKVNEVMTKILVGKGILLSWLREDIERTRENLKGLCDARKAFQRIFDSVIEDDIKSELIEMAIRDRTLISTAEDTISRLEFLIGYGISVERGKDFESFKSKVESAYQKTKILESEYKIPRDEISILVRGKSLNDAEMLLGAELARCSEGKRVLLEAWQIYVATLQSIGRKVPDVPHGLQELQEGVEGLRKECLDALGEDGLKILAFLRGEVDFPDGVSKGSIKKALEVLRPIFMRLLKEESSARSK